MVVLYGDLLFRGYILRDLLDSDAEITAVVDSAPILAPPSGSPGFAYCSRPDDRSLLAPDIRLLRISSERSAAGVAPSGRFIGMLRVRGAGRDWLTNALATLRERPESPQLSIPDLLNHLVALGWPVQVLYIHGHWLDVNSLADLERAGDFTRGGSGK
jgi:phosphoenolpyruvate phosphomutase